MSPFDRISREYAERPRERPLAEYVDWHMRNGFVFSTPDFFIMGRAVNGRCVERWAMAEGQVAFDQDPAAHLDTWYVHAMAGDMSKAWSILPYHLPWIAFERLRQGKLELTFVPLDRMRRLVPLNSLNENIPAQATD